jgi:glutamyl-tRNA synthetase
MSVLREAREMLGFIVDDEFAIDPAAGEKFLGVEQRPTLQAARDAIAGLDEWSAAAIEAALRHALVDGLGLKPKHAFGPVRVAVTGRTVSPPLFESIELLGKVEALVRLDAALAL